MICENSDTLISTCPGCWKKLDFETLSEKGFQLRKCRKCNLVFTFPQPADEVITKIYQENYFLNLDEKGNLQIEEAKKRLKVIGKYIGHGKEILDVGCGTGIFLSLISSGNEVNGIEVYPKAVEVARKKIGDKIFLGELESAKFANEYFDVVTSIHTIEHVRNPSSILKECYRILKPKGFLVIETPNRNFLFRLPYGYGQPSPAEHLFQFNPSNLEKLLRVSGFEVVKITFLPPTFNGGLRGMIEYLLRGFAYFIGKLLNLNVSDNILLVVQRSRKDGE